MEANNNNEKHSLRGSKTLAVLELRRLLGLAEKAGLKLRIEKHEDGSYFPYTMHLEHLNGDPICVDYWASEAEISINYWGGKTWI